MNIQTDRALIPAGSTAERFLAITITAHSRGEEEVERLIQEAITEHVALLRAQGHQIPEPRSSTTEVEIEQAK